MEWMKSYKAWARSEPTRFANLMEKIAEDLALAERTLVTHRTAPLLKAAMDVVWNVALELADECDREARKVKAEIDREDKAYAQRTQPPRRGSRHWGGDFSLDSESSE